MLSELLLWWKDGLCAPLPRWFQTSSRCCWIRPLESGFDFSYNTKFMSQDTVKAGRGSVLPKRARKWVKSSQVVLQLPIENALISSLKLSPGVDPEDHIESKLEELSPLPLDQQYVDNIVDKDNLTLVIARRSVIDNLLVELDNVGVKVDRVTVKGYEDTSLNLLPGLNSKSYPADTLGFTLVAVGVLTCCAGAYLLIQKQADELNNLGAREVRLQSKWEGGNRVRDRIVELEDQVSVIVDRTQKQPSTLALLTEVTGSIPDHTWIRQWILHGELLTLFGETADTADLIARLEASSLLRNVQYESAITRDPDSERARVRISGKVGYQ